MIHNIKHYILNPIPSKPTLPKPIVASVAIYHLMPIIQVQIGKNFIEYVFLNGGPGVNIVMEKLRVQLGLSKPKPSPYNICMVN
jgi:hypothetical protein